MSFMDRVFFSASAQEPHPFRFKPAAAVVSARRAGTTSTLDQMNKYFFHQQMIDRILWFLTDIQRAVYRLVKIVGHTQTEAADILGTSIPNINKHLKKAMDRIEEQKEKM